jgi:hypothetical protein
VEVVSQRDDRTVSGEGDAGEAEVGEQSHPETQRVLDLGPVLLQVRHGLAIEVVHLETDVALPEQHQSGLQNQVLAEGETLPDPVEFVDEPVDGLARIVLDPLGGGHREKKVGVGEDGASRVDPDEDVEDLVELLRFLEEEVHRGGDVYDLVQAGQNMAGGVVVRDPLTLKGPDDVPSCA